MSISGTLAIKKIVLITSILFVFVGLFDKHFKLGETSSERCVSINKSVTAKNILTYVLTLIRSARLSGAMSSNPKSAVTKSLLQTSVIKDLRQQKERQKHRKSMLIYGTKDMKKKLFERENRQKNKSKRSGINV